MSEEVEDFLAEIDDLLEQDDYRFARETLTGIHATVARTNEITVNQRRAIHNIRASKTGENRQGPNWKRRYEGHS